MKTAMTRGELRKLYRRRAKHYDATSHAYGLLGYRLDEYRRRGIDALQLEPGDTVVELGCGTGANFPLLQRAVGPTGSIIGVDLTADMLARASARVRRERWSNVRLVESDVARFAFPAPVDGILSTYALTLVPSYDEVIRHGAEALSPGARFVIVDLKAPAGWPDVLLRAAVPLFRPFGVTIDLSARHPWESLAEHLELVSMQEQYLGTTYVAVGEKRLPRSRDA